MALLVSLFWPRHRKAGCNKVGGRERERQFQGEGWEASSHLLKKKKIIFLREKFLNRMKVIDLKVINSYFQW